MHVKKSTLFVNLYVTLFIFFVPPTLFSFKKQLDLYLNNKKSDKRADLPAYSNKSKAKTVLKEFKMLSTEYKSFLGWRRKPFVSEYTNIKGKYQNRVSTNESLDNSFWFFGGSTIWGTGVSDYNTIPSFFAKISGEKVFNFGETGWTSRQSLNQLINLIGDGEKPKVVIFYTGINDYHAGCRAENKVLAAHDRDQQFSTIINDNKTKNFIKWLFNPYLSISKKINIKQKNNRLLYDCLTDDKKAISVANHFINNLYTAFLVSKRANSEFFFILQPSIYSSTSPKEYLDIDNQTRLRNQKVFNLIANKMEEICKKDREFCISFADGRSWLNVNDKVFIDDAHLTPKGNRLIAEKIIKLSNIKNN